jgi:uncharacterized protein YkwD
LRRIRSILIALVAASVLAVPAFAVGRTTGVVARPALDARIISAINIARAEHGLRAVRLSAPLTTSAGAHSQEMIDHGFFAHQSYGGGDFWSRIARFYPSSGYPRWRVGETILWFSPDVDAAAAVRDWLNSPPHRRVLLSPAWHEIGVAALHASSAPGAFDGLESTVITADFGFRAR